MSCCHPAWVRAPGLPVVCSDAIAGIIFLVFRSMPLLKEVVSAKNGFH
jgi:hypothetical protein